MCVCVCVILSSPDAHGHELSTATSACRYTEGDKEGDVCMYEELHLAVSHCVMIVCVCVCVCLCVCVCVCLRAKDRYITWYSHGIGVHEGKQPSALEEKRSAHQLRGWTAVSAAGSQGKGSSHTGSVFFADAGITLLSAPPGACLGLPRSGHQGQAFRPGPAHDCKRWLLYVNICVSLSLYIYIYIYVRNMYIYIYTYTK